MADVKPIITTPNFLDTPWLIQRASFKHYRQDEAKPKNPTYDELVSNEYMGSAEFEFGALPKSLKTITKGLERLSIFGFNQLKDYRGDDLCILAANKEVAERYFSWIQEMVSNNYDGSLRLKESTRIWDHLPHEVGYENDPIMYRQIKDSKQYGREKEIWWDIRNHIFFCFGHKKLKKIVHAIENTRSKKKRQHAEATDQKEKELLATWF